MNKFTRVTEIADPQGGRNRIRANDAVKVTKGGADRSSFLAEFRYADVDDDGNVVQITVFGGPKYDPAFPWNGQHRLAHALTRTVVPKRVQRVSQAHVDRRKRVSS